jgi:hypothetical protein
MQIFLRKYTKTFAQNLPYKKNVKFANIYAFICEKDINNPIMLNIPHNIKHNTETTTL